MANTIKLQIELDSKGAITNLTSLDTKLKKTGDTGKKSFSKMDGAISSFAGNLGAIATTKAFSIISRGFTQGARDALDFSTALAEINSLVPRTASETQKLAQNLITLSSTYGKSAQGQAKAFYNIVSAGITDTTKATRVLTIANKASVAGVTDVDTATRGLLSVVNSYTDGSVDAERASDILFATIREGRTTFPELADTIGRVASISAAAKVKFSELAGALAFVTKSGIRTDEAVIGLRGLLTGIIGPTDGVKKVAKDLGIEWNASALQAKGLSGVLNELAQKTGGNVESIRKLIPNVRAFNVAVKIAGGDLGDFNRILDETANSSDGVGATQKALAIITDSAGFQFTKLQTQLKNLPLAFLTNFEEPIADALKAMNKFVGEQGILLVVDAVNIVIDSIQELVTLKNDTTDFFDSISKAASDLVDSMNGQGNVVEGLTYKLGLQNEKLEELRKKYLEMLDVGDKNTGSIKKQIEQYQRAADATKNQLDVFQQADLAEARIEQNKISRRAKSQASIDAFQAKLAAGREKELADKKANAVKDIEIDNQNAALALENKLANESNTFNAIEELKAAQKETEVEKKLEENLGKELENEDVFIALEEKLGREEALRELFRISQIQNEEKRISELRKLNIKADKVEAKRLEEVEKQKLAFRKLTAQQSISLVSNTGNLINAIAGKQTKAGFVLSKVAAAAQVLVQDGQARAAATAAAAGAAAAAGPAAPAVFSLTMAQMQGLITANTALSLGTIAASTIRGFAEGGIIEGNSSVGDNNLALVNSGEMIINKRQQQNLFKQINGGGDSQGENGNTFIFNNPVLLDESGTDLIIDNINDRIEFGNKQLRA